MESKILQFVFLVCCVGNNSALGNDRLLRVVEERLKINSISLNMEIVTPTAPPGREEYVGIVRSYNIEMIPSKKLFRQVQEWSMPSGKKVDILLKNQNGYLVDKGGLVNASLTTKDEDGIFVDVRLFGLVPSNPSSTIGRLSPEAVNYVSAATEEAIETENDVTLTNTIYRLASDRTIKIWFSPECGMNPVRLRFDLDGKYSQQVDTTYTNFGRVHGWFPTEVRYRQFDILEKVKFEEVAKLTSIVFDRVEENDFETDKLPIIDGRRLIVDGGYAKRFNVRTGKFEDSNPTDVVDLATGTYVRLGSVPAVRSYRWSALIFVISLIFVIVVAIRRFRSRQKSRF